MRVLLICVTAPPVGSVQTAIGRLHAAGAQVEALAAPAFLPLLATAGVDGCTRLTLLRQPTAGWPAPMLAVLPSLVRRVVLRIRWDLLRAVQGRSSHTIRTWRLFRQDAKAVEAAGRADVVVALDRFAVYSAWRIRRRTGAKAFHGIHTAVEWVVARADNPLDGDQSRGGRS